MQRIQLYSPPNRLRCDSQDGCHYSSFYSIFLKPNRHEIHSVRSRDCPLITSTNIPGTSFIAHIDRSLSKAFVKDHIAYPCSTRNSNHPCQWKIPSVVMGGTQTFVEWQTKALPLSWPGSLIYAIICIWWPYQFHFQISWLQKQTNNTDFITHFKWCTPSEALGLHPWNGAAPHHREARNPFQYPLGISVPTMKDGSVNEVRNIRDELLERSNVTNYRMEWVKKV